MCFVCKLLVLSKDVNMHCKECYYITLDWIKSNKDGRYKIVWKAKFTLCRHIYAYVTPTKETVCDVEKAQTFAAN